MVTGLDDRRFSYQAASEPRKETSAWCPLQVVYLPCSAWKGRDSSLELV